VRKKTRAIALAAIGLLLSGLLLVWSSRGGERAASPGAVTPHDGSAPGAELAGSNEVENGAERDVSERSEAAAGALASAATEPETADTRLRGRVLDAAGAPIAGAQVEVQHAPSDSFSTLDSGFRRAVSRVASISTDAGGGFAVEVAERQLFQLSVSSAGYGPVQVPHCKASEFVEVRLQRAAALFGVVVRRADDSPVAGARVSVWPRGKLGELTAFGGRRETVTDGAGRYRLDGLAPGPFNADVEHTGDASPPWLDIELAAGEAREQNFALEAGATIRGHVTDAQTGAPIAGAQIGQGWTFDSSVTSDESGAYEVRGFSAAYRELHARARGYGRSEARVHEPLARVTQTVADFALTPARRAQGRIVAEGGTPVAGAYVAGAAYEYRGNDQRLDWTSTDSGADGTFELVDLRSDLHHTLFVRREGFGTVAYEFPADEAQRATIELGDIALPPAASVLGLVVDALGQPFANQLVEFHGINRDRSRLMGDAPFVSYGIDLYVAARETRTDDRGRFRFDDVAPGDYALFASVDSNHEKAASLDVAVERGATRSDLVLVIDRGLSIEGVVRVSDGGALPHVYVSVDPQGDGKSADCEVAGGRFKAQGLSATTYTLTAYPYPSADDKAAGRLFLPTVLEGVAAGARDVVIELLGALVAHGRVLDADGGPVALAPIVLRDARGRELAHSVSLGNGTFEITVPAGERFELEAQPPQPPIDVSSEPPPDPSTFATLANLSGNDAVFELRLHWRR
jgi:protocatechuate 3,4-dioxygenase beta subunit